MPQTTQTNVTGVLLECYWRTRQRRASNFHCYWYFQHRNLLLVTFIVTGALVSHRQLLLDVTGSYWASNSVMHLYPNICPKMTHHLGGVRGFSTCAGQCFCSDCRSHHSVRHARTNMQFSESRSTICPRCLHTCTRSLFFHTLHESRSLQRYCYRHAASPSTTYCSATSAAMQQVLV